MALFDIVKKEYPKTSFALKNIIISSPQEFLDYYGLSAEKLTDDKGNSQEAFGITANPDGKYDLNTIAMEITDYLPKLSNGSPMFTTRVTNGSKFKLISFISQLIDQTKLFNSSKHVSMIVEDQLNYDQILAELIKQGIVRFILVKQDDQYLIISYFNQGSLLSDIDVEDLIQVVVNGDLKQFKKTFDLWTVYKINHDVAYYNKLLGSVNDSKSSTNLLNLGLVYNPVMVAKLKRQIDHINYLAGVVRGNQLQGYQFVF